VREVLGTVIDLIRGNYDKSRRYTHFTTSSVYVFPWRKKLPMQIDGEVVTLPYMDIGIKEQALAVVTNKKF
jgi:diacylglycerol kinase family enzyme